MLCAVKSHCISNYAGVPFSETAQNKPTDPPSSSSLSYVI